MTKCNRVHRCSAIALIAAVCLLAGGNLSAQELSFRHLAIDDGLSQNAVYSILKDSQGFMWFGTKDGLNRYDGRNYIVYQHDPFDEMRGKLTEDRGPKNVDGMTEDGGLTDESPFELPYIKDKIMQPFFTMKKGTQGIGLGLNITNYIVKAHGSTINIKTEEHEGATFIIELHV